MNLFYLHYDPTQAAQALSDQHVRKMILETAQILDGGTRHILCDLFPGADHEIVRIPKSQRDNPVILSVRDPRVFSWALDHFLALLAEYRFRWEADHAYEGKVHRFATRERLVSPHLSGTRGFRLAMPARYNPLQAPYTADAYFARRAYRAYYAAEKLRTARGPAMWTRRAPPLWLGALAAERGFQPVYKPAPHSDVDRTYFEEKAA